MLVHSSFLPSPLRSSPRLRSSLHYLEIPRCRVPGLMQLSVNHERNLRSFRRYSYFTSYGALPPNVNCPVQPAGCFACGSRVLRLRSEPAKRLDAPGPTQGPRIPRFIGTTTYTPPTVPVRTQTMGRAVLCAATTTPAGAGLTGSGWRVRFYRGRRTGEGVGQGGGGAQ